MTLELQNESTVLDIERFPLLAVIDLGPLEEIVTAMCATTEYDMYVASTATPADDVTVEDVAGRRPSHMARCFKRHGRRYMVRKDHGTKAGYAEIAATRARWSAGAQSPDGRRALRRELRKALYGGEGSAYEITGTSI